jgi:hypothetical protein
VAKRRLDRCLRRARAAARWRRKVRFSDPPQQPPFERIRGTACPALPHSQVMRRPLVPVFVIDRTAALIFGYLWLLAQTQGGYAMSLIVVSAGTQNSETVKERSCPPNASHKTINDGPQLIGLYEGQADCCPNCRTPFEIVSVEFKFGGVAMIASCPNCAIAADWSVVESKTLNELKNLCGACFKLLGRVVSIIDQLSFRFRYFVAILFVTVIFAGVLRHLFHVYGGLSREEIRASALMAIPAIVLAIIFFQRKPQR